MQVTYSDIVARFDVRTVLRQSFDDDEEHSEEELAGSPILAAALSDAVGAFEAAIFVSHSYTKDQIESFTPTSKGLAIRIICELATAYLYERRGTDDNQKVREAKEDAEAYLTKIRNGERLFVVQDDDSVQNAGLASLVAPDVVQLQNLNGITYRAKGYFPPLWQRQHIAPYGD